MRYDIGEYGLTRGKDVCWASPDKPIHYLWYVEESVEEGFGSYEEAVERIKEKMRSDKETGRQDELLKDNHLIVYFTAGWADYSCYLKMHIAGTYDKEVLDIVHEYDDRILVEQV